MLRRLARFRALTHSDCMTLYFVQAAQQFSNLPTFFTFLFQQLWWVVSNRKKMRFNKREVSTITTTSLTS